LAIYAPRIGGLTTHKGPILTLANWSGTAPGLVGMLNINGSLAKAGVKFSTLWSENFDDDYFLEGIKQWLQTGTLTMMKAIFVDFDTVHIPEADGAIGSDFAAKFQKR
jgi:hypothetical protein